jgi:methyl-accepting chemotaxis protein
MNLNVFNNFKAVYYNTLTNFYLYFNTIVPYYDDVILSLSITSFKNIIKNSKIKFKENRLIQLIYSLDDKDSIVVDDDGFVFVDYYIKEPVSDNEVIDDEVADTSEPVADTSDPVADTSDPVADTSEPVADTSEPVADTSDPVADTSDPVADTSDPVADTSEPVVDTSDPVADTSDPVADTSDPVADTSDPVADTSDPVAEPECYDSLEKKNN